MKKILLAGSESSNWDDITYEDKWYNIIEQDFKEDDFTYYMCNDVLVSDTTNLFHNYFRFYYAQIAVLDFLIEDCMPRIVNKSSILYRALRKVVGARAANRITLSVGRPKANNASISAKSFEMIYRNLVENLIQNGTEHIFLLKHTFTCEDESFNSMLHQNVERYSQVMDELSNVYPDKVKLIRVESKITGDCMNGMCITKESQQKIAEVVKLQLKSII